MRWLFIVVLLAGCTAKSPDAVAEEPKEPINVDDGSAPGEPMAADPVRQTFWLHSDGTRHYMDGTPAPDAEAGDRATSIGKLVEGYTATFTGDLEANHHANETSVLVNLQGYSWAGAVLPEMTAQLRSGDAEVGRGVRPFSSPVYDTVMAQAGPCPDILIEFVTAQAITAGEPLTLTVELTQGAAYIECYPGGAGGPRIEIG